MDSAADLVIGNFELSRLIAHRSNTSKNEKVSQICLWRRATGQAAFLFLPAHGDVWSTENPAVANQGHRLAGRRGLVPRLTTVDTPCAPGSVSTSWSPPKKDIFSSSVGRQVRLRQQVTY